MTETTAPPTPEAVAAVEESMVAAGVPLTEKVQVDYFGIEEVRQVNLPDGISFIQHKVMNEGDRRKYLNGMNRDVTIQKSTGDAKLQMRPGDERYALLKSAICGWNLTRNGHPLNFSPTHLEQFLNSAPPKVIDLIDKEVRKANAWLVEDMSVEDIDKEIETLQELRQAKLDDEAGN